MQETAIEIDDPLYQPAGKLKDAVAIITGGDSGIGAATAILFAKEGARVVIGYLDEEDDANRVVQTITEQGGDAIAVRGDLRVSSASHELVRQTIDHFGMPDILVNNAGTQVQQDSLNTIDNNQLEDTFRTNVFSMFYATRAILPFLGSGSSIINTTSVTAYRGSDELIDYSATKGAITSFTRSLSQNLAHKNIRVNAVAPGPVWTPLIFASFDEEHISEFGKQQPLGWAAQPIEIAPAYVFLASRDARYITGQVLHVNGGEIVNG